MTTKIATRSSSGLRPQGTGGQTVQQAYQAIVHYLRRGLSESHALLLAEPNQSDRGGMIDWYSEGLDAAGAVPIDAVPPERRGAIYARLAALMNDIRARAEELKNSSRQSERLLGQMLLLALEIPNEECLFVVGDQPVLIFWGYLADAPSPQRGVIDRMIAESRRPRQPSPSPEAPQAKVVERPPAVEPPSDAPAPPPRTGYRWLPLLLWLVFTALCLVIALDLLYASGTGASVAGQHAPAADRLLSGRDGHHRAFEAQQELESQNQILQGQLDRLLGAITARRQQCAEAAGPGRARPVNDLPTPIPIPTAALPIVSETPPPLPADTPSAPPVALDTPIQIPTETDSLASLAGCWGGPAAMKDWQANPGELLLRRDGPRRGHHRKAGRDRLQRPLEGAVGQAGAEAGDRPIRGSAVPRRRQLLPHRGHLRARPPGTDAVLGKVRGRWRAALGHRVTPAGRSGGSVVDAPDWEERC